MEHIKTVKDLMIPLSEYAVIDQDATLLDALNELDEAQKNLPAKSYRHRAVLVRNKKGKIVGRLGHFAFIKALNKPTHKFLDNPYLRRAGVSEDMLNISKDRMSFMNQDISLICSQARYVKVGDIVLSGTQKIDETATLQEALELFIKHESLSLLVTRGTEVVGILRVADFFEELANYMKEC